MSGVWGWVKEHPYITGGAILSIIVLWYVLTSSSSSSSSSAPVSSNPGGVSDAVYAAQLAANSTDTQTAAAQTVASDNTAASLSAALAQYQSQSDIASTQAGVVNQQTISQAQTLQYQTAAQLQAAYAADAAANFQTSTTTAAGVQVAGLDLVGLQDTNASQVDIAGINANAGVQVASIQGGVAINGQNDALTLGENTNATSLSVTTLNDSTAAVINGQNTTAAVNIAGGADATQVALGQDAVNIAGGADATTVAVNNANQTTNQALIDATSLAGSQQFTLADTSLNLLGTGMFNKGGEGGINQVTALGEITGSPAAPVSAAAAGGVGATQAGPGSLAGQVNAFANLAGKLVGGLVGGAGAPAPGTPNPITSLGVPAVTSTFTPASA